jgi:hypothetical protein
MQSTCTPRDGNEIQMELITYAIQLYERRRYGTAKTTTAIAMSNGDHAPGQWAAAPFFKY